MARGLKDNARESPRNVLLAGNLDPHTREGLWSWPFMRSKILSIRSLSAGELYACGPCMLYEAL